MKFQKDNLKLRLYQQSILATAAEHNTFVVLPTGLGKTFVAIGLAGLRFKLGKILLMAPTKPLCVQHKETFSEFFSSEELVVLTGAVPPAERKKLWKEGSIFFSTPQTVENDLLKGYFTFTDFSLAVFDEAHRSTGEYAYVWLAEQYVKQAKQPRILALSASPASTSEQLDIICRNLRIDRIEVRGETDADVREYVKSKEIKKIFLKLPLELNDILRWLERALSERLRELKDREVLESADSSKVRKIHLLTLQRKISSQIRSGEITSYEVVSLLAACIKLQHALELLQTQGLHALQEFFGKLSGQASIVKASKNIIEDWNIKRARIQTSKLCKEGFEIPKFDELRKIVSNSLVPGKRVIVFTQYRSSVERILAALAEVKQAKPVKFIGQKEGMSQKKQVEVLQRFKDGEFNVLVATSVSEEGLHIENADVGVFFEPVPSALRSIQRRGRIGRVNFGKVYLLITKGTIDEKYYWTAWHKERKMGDLLESLKSAPKKNQTSLDKYNGRR